MTDPLLLPAHEQRRLLGARAIGAVELLDLALARADALGPALNPLAARDPEGARRAAAESDRRLAAGEGRALEGLPITVKDAFDVAGVVSTAGLPAHAGRVPGADAAAVARLRAAGAVIHGKSVVPVMSGDFQAFNPLHGAANNPWDAARSPGGSSGGAAAAVATGISSAELGSDLGGSVRWPASACGIYGLKPTWGLVPTWGHVPPMPDRRLERPPELVVAGPLARSAEDLDLLLGVLAGPRDPALPGPALAPPRRADPRGLRVAVWLEEPLAPVDEAVADGVRAAARALEAAGAVLDRGSRPVPFAEAFEVFALLNHAFVAHGLPERVRERIAAGTERYGAGDLDHRALQARGARMGAELFADLGHRRAGLRRRWARFFASHDVLLCPPAPVRAIPHDHGPDVHARALDVNGLARPYLDFLHWSSLATGADLPAAVAPVDPGGGLPRGVQVIAAAGEDRTAVAVAGMIGRLAGGYRPPPVVAGLGVAP